MKRFAVPLAIIAVSTLVAFAAAEVLLRAIGFHSPVWYQPDPVLGWKLRPGLAAWYTAEGKGLVRVNSQGLRDKEHRLDKPPGVYRIAVLGDSYSEARQVAAEEAFWALLPQELAACGFPRGKEQGKQVEVLNFGVSGWGTAQQAVALESMAMRYSPDLVLLQFTNGNDVRNNSFALEEEKARPFFMLEPDGRLRLDDSFASSAGFRQHSSTAYELFRKVSDKSRVIQLVRDVKKLPLMQAAHADSGNGAEQGLEMQVLAAPKERLWQEAWTITEGLIARAAGYSKRNGAQFLVVTVPYAIQVHPDAQVRAALQKKLGVDDLFYPDRRVSEFAKKNGISALALAPAMQPLAESSKAYFHGFQNVGMGRGHWNPEGHRAAARLIAEHLCKAG